MRIRKKTTDNYKLYIHREKKRRVKALEREKPNANLSNTKNVLEKKHSKLKFKKIANGKATKEDA